MSEKHSYLIKSKNDTQSNMSDMESTYNISVIKSIDVIDNEIKNSKINIVEYTTELASINCGLKEVYHIFIF